MGTREFWLYQEESTKPWEVYDSQEEAEEIKEHDGGDGIIIHVREIEN